MLAFGAVACAHSTSSDVSMAHPSLLSSPVPLLGGGGLLADTNTACPTAGVKRAAAEPDPVVAMDPDGLIAAGVNAPTAKAARQAMKVLRFMDPSCSWFVAEQVSSGVPSNSMAPGCCPRLRAGCPRIGFLISIGRVRRRVSNLLSIPVQAQIRP